MKSRIASLEAELTLCREVKRLYLLGKYTQAEIAAQVGSSVTQPWVSRFLREEGLIPSRATILEMARKRDQPIEVADPVLEAFRRMTPADRRATREKTNEVKAVLVGRHGKAKAKK